MLLVEFVPFMDFLEHDDGVGGGVDSLLSETRRLGAARALSMDSAVSGSAVSCLDHGPVAVLPSRTASSGIVSRGTLPMLGAAAVGGCCTGSGAGGETVSLLARGKGASHASGGDAPSRATSTPKHSTRMRTSNITFALPRGLTVVGTALRNSCEPNNRKSLMSSWNASSIMSSL